MGRLRDFLAPLVPTADFADLQVAQFAHGQSNPTYMLTPGKGNRLVLRKQPPGKLLRGAHDVLREGTIMEKLRGIVPVPTVRAKCEDAGIAGTPFIVYDMVEGRQLLDVCMPELADEPGRRSDVLCGLARTLGR